jgi:hypothetical protein
MRMLHPDGVTECEVNPADAEDEATLKANGWKPVGKAAKAEAQPVAEKPVAAPKAPKTPKAKTPKPE